MIDEMLEGAFDEFTAAMRQRLEEKAASAWTGWENETTATVLDLEQRAVKNLQCGDYVDAADLIMMIWARTTIDGSPSVEQEAREALEKAEADWAAATQGLPGPGMGQSKTR
jgi:hypothetical protein